MKITRIELFKVDLPYAGGIYLLSGGRTYESFDSSIVRITCDDGTQGWGESTPFGSTYIAAHALGARAGIAELAPALLGRDPRRVDRINDLMDATLVGHNHAKTPLDVACWDIFGKSVGLPVCELLGGSTGIPMPMISSIYAGDPEDMRRRVAEHRARGYLGHSIKIGALDSEGGPALDAERIAASLADKRPGEFFIVDANGGLIPETACGCSGCSRLDWISSWRPRAPPGGKPSRSGSGARTPSSLTSLPSRTRTSRGPSPMMQPTGSD